MPSRSRTPENDAERYGSILEYKGFVVGVFFLVATVPLIAIILRALPPEVVSRWLIFPVFEIDLSLELFPQIEAGEFDPTNWLWERLYEIGRIALVGGFYLAILGAVIGMLLVTWSAIMIGTSRAIARTAINACRYRIIQGLLGLYTITALGIFYPFIFRILAELMVALVVGGTVVGVLGMGWWRLRATQGRVVRIGLLYPLAIGIVALPIVAIALASPTLGPWFQTISTELAILVLDTILAVGGLNEWLRATFDLEGLNYFLMWLGIVLVVGWMVGVIVERFALLTVIRSRLLNTGS